MDSTFPGRFRRSDQHAGEKTEFPTFSQCAASERSRQDEPTLGTTSTKTGLEVSSSTNGRSLHLVVGNPMLRGGGYHRSPPGRAVELVVIVILASLTSWAIASVSIWLVPCYLAAMVVIFLAPWGGRASAAPLTDGLRTGVPPPDSASSQAGDPAGPEPEASEVTTSGARERFTDAVSAKAASRRGRARGRKLSKPSPEMTWSAARWIQVAPGKFVRADLNATGLPGELAAEPDPRSFPAGRDEPALASVVPRDEARPPQAGQADASPQPQSETLAASNTISLPSSDGGTESDPHQDPSGFGFEVAKTAFADGARQGSCLSGPPEPEDHAGLNPGVESGSASPAEEYGIAPSAFGLDPLMAAPPNEGDPACETASVPDHATVEIEAGPHAEPAVQSCAQNRGHGAFGDGLDPGSDPEVHRSLPEGNAALREHGNSPSRQAPPASGGCSTRQAASLQAPNGVCQARRRWATLGRGVHTAWRGRSRRRRDPYRSVAESWRIRRGRLRGQRRPSNRSNRARSPPIGRSSKTGRAPRWLFRSWGCRLACNLPVPRETLSQTAPRSRTSELHHAA